MLLYTVHDKRRELTLYARSQGIGTARAGAGAVGGPARVFSCFSIDTTRNIVTRNIVIYHNNIIPIVVIIYVRVHESNRLE